MNRRHIFVLTFFSLLALVLTFPLLAHFGDHVPGTATWSLDEYGYVWNNWWFKYSVFDRGTNPFYTQFLFYPLGTTLVLYAFTLLHVLLALPLQLAFSLIPAVNATVVFSFAISAFGMYLFLTYLIRVSIRIWSEKYGERVGASASEELVRTLAAIVGGIAFAFTSNRFVYLSLGHYNIVASEWLPFYLLFLFRTLLGGDWRNGALAGLFAAFALYTETTDGVLIALVTAVILVFEWRLINRDLLRNLALTAATAGILFSPMLIPTLNELFAGGYSLPGWGHSEKLLVDLAGFLEPTSLNPFNRHWENELDLVRQGISRFSDVNTFFVGYLTVTLAIVGAIRFPRRTKLWIAIVLVFSVLSLGPILHVNGISEFDLDGLSTTFPLPFLLLHYIPLIRENRVPNRYSILVTIGLAVLIAYAVRWILVVVSRNRFAKRGAILPLAVSSVLGLGLLVEHLALPLPLTDATIPDIYNTIGRETGDFTILSVPLGWRNSFGQMGAEDTRTQYYQAASHKFILTGQIQRNPPILFDYFQRSPILSSIIALETYNSVDAVTIARDRALAPEFVYFFDLRYLVVNAAVPNRPPYSDTRQSTIDYLSQVLPIREKIYDRDGTTAYRIDEPQRAPDLYIDMGTEAAHLYEGEGWAGDEIIAGVSGNWGTRQNARLFLPIREIRDYSLTVRARPFDFAGHNQSLTLALNGHLVLTVPIAPDWTNYEFTLPKDFLHNGLNEITWQFGYLVRPSDAVPPDYAIGTTGLKSPVDMSVQSTSGFGSIKITGREVSPLKRGYNLVTVDPASGAVLEARNFDTGGTSILESRSLTDFISKLPDGLILVGAAQENAGTTLGDRAAAALKSLGLSTDLRLTPGSTHAFVVVKGKGGGLEASGRGSSILSIGHSVDDRLLGVAFDWVKLAAN